MRPLSRIALGSTLAMFVALVGGCASDSTAPSTSALTNADAMRIGAQLTRELSASMSAVGAGGSASSIASTHGSAARVAAAFSRVPGASRSAVDVAPACPSLDNTIDSDGDGVPNDATATFALPQCRSILFSDTTEVTGTVEITDPIASPPPNPAAFGFAAQLHDFTVRFGAAESGASFTETRNGGEGLLFAPQGLQQVHHVSIVRQDSSGTTTVTENLQALFAPAAGAVLVPGQALPNGEYAATGQSSWQHGGVAAALEVATAVPLAYDATCAAGSPTPFRSGEVHVHAAGNGGQAVVRIVFANCQSPAVTLVAHN